MHFLGGATLDSEENYLIKKFFTALGRAVDREPGPDMTQLDGPRSGDLVRARRRHHVPAGSAELRLHPDHGLEHGRAAPGRLPVGDRGQGARRQGDPRRSAVHAHERDGRPARPDPARHRHRVPGRDRQLHLRARRLVRGVRPALHQRPGDHQARSFEDTEDDDGLLLGLEPRAQRLRRSRPGATTRPAARPPRASQSSRPTSRASRPTAPTA